MSCVLWPSCRGEVGMTGYHACGFCRSIRRGKAPRGLSPELEEEVCHGQEGFCCCREAWPQSHEEMPAKQPLMAEMRCWWLCDNF